MHLLHATSLNYLIGKFTKPHIIDKETLSKWIATIEVFPASIKKLTKNLSPQELEKNIHLGIRTNHKH